jgi:SAM-dependent methyltransferase
LPQSEARDGADPFAAIYADPDRLRVFARAMTASFIGTATAIADRFPFDRYSTFVDLGCAEGALPALVAGRHPGIEARGFDLPRLRPSFEEYVAEAGVSDRVSFVAGDFWVDEFPSADVISLCRVLHDWDRDEKLELLRKAHDALPVGGAVIVCDALIDDERRENAYGLLMSLNMLIETNGGFDYTAADCCSWMEEAGFSVDRVERLDDDNGFVVGVKH